jgi:GntR family transcriptional regulator
VVELNFRTGEPIYLQIADQFERQIADGELKPGDQLPTVRELADQLEVNFNTVARAYRILDESGAISTQQGRGTYVIEPRARGRATLEEIASRFAVQAHRLGYDPEEVAQAVGYVLGRWEQEGKPPAE